MNRDSFLNKKFIVNDLRLLQCPISMTIFYDPVIAKDGYTYERNSIEIHFLTKKTSPMTNENIETHLTPNLIIKQIILKSIKTHSHLRTEYEESKNIYYKKINILTNENIYIVVKGYLSGDINIKQQITQKYGKISDWNVQNLANTFPKPSKIAAGQINFSDGSSYPVLDNSWQ